MALYDPKEFPEAEVKQDFTLADVLAWARTKPADETYCYVDPGNCAVCQFLRETGRANDPRVVLNYWRDGFDEPRYKNEFDERVSKAANWATLNNEGFNASATFAEFAAELEARLA